MCSLKPSTQHLEIVAGFSEFHTFVTCVLQSYGGKSGHQYISDDISFCGATRIILSVGRSFGTLEFHSTLVIQNLIMALSWFTQCRGVVCALRTALGCVPLRSVVDSLDRPLLIATIKPVTLSPLAVLRTVMQNVYDQAQLEIKPS